MRIGIVGARRAEQGIGQFVARDLAALGADVVAIVGTREETIAVAAAELKRLYGLEVRGYHSVEAMLAKEELDAMAICSPQQFHAEQMQAALQHRVHVLCEKPLVFTPGADNVAAARPLVEGFAEAGLVLMVNQQWPYTLRAFDQCWPSARAKSVTHLEMLLAPAEDGPGMIPNAMPHVLSLLLSCVPTGGRMERPRMERPVAGRLNVKFDYVHTAGHTSVQAWFIQAPRQPRPAGYAINDCTVRRTIRMSDYAMFLEMGDQRLSEIARGGPELAVSAATADSDEKLQRVPLEDPLRLLLADFISRCRAGNARGVDPALLDNVRLLDALYAAAVDQIAK
ncbi:MAG: Gfo/Idh/MocA family oxidoreductase [Planctomycetes bacterium]|nr:Gfo/Idh/MocA family oxidoreductase [Planctomycetota bacterium]